MASERTIRVDLPGGGYDVTVGAGLLARAGAMAAPLAEASPARPGRAVVITDGNVRALYAGQVAQGLAAAGCRTDVIDFPPGEQSKNLRTYESVMDRLLGLSPAIDRRTLIVALGGGVVGDLAGFVAATALRGLPYVNVPTTLLADVDASVGGKTGLDAPAGKNLIGAFHQPLAVIVDAAALKTLPRAELANGLAECVKHALLGDGGLLDLLESQAEAIAAADAEVATELIARNVAIKAAIVAADEREADVRSHLNLGHTLGHAIEAAGGYGKVSHGQAVSLGLMAACRIAALRGLIGQDLLERIRRVLSGLSLPVRFGDLPDCPARTRDEQALWRIMRHDKKARAGVVRFVLPVGLGKAALFDDVGEQEVAEALAFLGA